MKRLSILRRILFIVVLLLIGALLASHIWLRSSRFTVTENGMVVSNALVYKWIGSVIYVTRPEWRDEAYMIDYRHNAVFLPNANQFLSNRTLLLATHWRVDSDYFGELDRQMPEFRGNAVTFSSNRGTQIVVRW
jgi:hypothetical protein